MPPQVPRKNLSADGTRRMGDPVPLPGDFEHYALTQGAAMQRRWHETKLELLDWFFIPEKGEKILDVGCGSGVFASRMAELGAEVTAVDSNEKVIDYGRENLSGRGWSSGLGCWMNLDWRTRPATGRFALRLWSMFFRSRWSGCWRICGGLCVRAGGC